MRIAVSGLGKMGMQIAERLVREGHEVIAHNRSPAKVDYAVGFGASGAYDRTAVVNAFQGQAPVIWMMVPANVVADELREWLAVLPQDSVIIDGGNSDFRQTQQHAVQVVTHGSVLIDVGTSGGVLGLTRGFSMMVGGQDEAVRVVTPALDSLVLPAGGWHHFGPSGAGHYVKMVHNAIEYGMMQSLAEGYRLLREGPYQQLSLAHAGAVWQKGSIVASSLNDMATQALTENPELQEVSGYVAESGEARWAIEVAREHAIAVPAIEAAMQVRLRSQQGHVHFGTKLLAAMRNKFGGHAINKE